MHTHICTLVIVVVIYRGVPLYHPGGYKIFVDNNSAFGSNNGNGYGFFGLVCVKDDNKNGKGKRNINRNFHCYQCRYKAHLMDHMYTHI